MAEIIIGSGLAGLGASYAFNEKGFRSILLERDWNPSMH